jgi:hypothetical protein
MKVKRSAIVAFWWFMVVTQYSGGALSAATQGPFGTQAQCDWGRQQIGVATGLRGGQGVGWGLSRAGATGSSLRSSRR